MGVVSSGPKGRLALMVDEATQQRFLVDTGSSYSILPHRSQEPTSGPCLCTADCSPIACWGDRKLHVAAGGRRFMWPFLLADVALPIIGADFLRHFGLLVDLGEMRLLARKGGWSQPLVALFWQEKEAHRGGSYPTWAHSGGMFFNFTSHGGGTLLSFTSHSGGMWQQPFSSARVG